LKALEAIKTCSKIYLENYTVDYPYKIGDLNEVLKRKVIALGREDVENEKIVDEAKKENICLLVYGNPLSATTHIQLILKCKKDKMQYSVIHSESILTAIAETGLQLYKFGKTASMPRWQKSYKPTSFMAYIRENLNIQAHTLLLTDIGLQSKDALEQLEEAAKIENIKLDKIIIHSSAGTPESKIYYDKIEKLKKKKISLPFCIIIPGELHFLEKEALDVLKEN
jgi:diphthine synthase